MKRAAIAILAAATLAVPIYATAAPAGHPQAEAQALELAKQAIALRSVRGPGNQTPQVAALYKAALVAGGFADADVTITPVDDTAFIIARWHGSDPKLKPLVISGHMDVVEAKPADWQRDPFTPVVENGYLYGRGATDMKLDGTIAIAALIELRRSGYKPRRDIVIEFSGDEETVMKTSGMIADQLANADLVLNIDGGGGKFDEKTGAPLFFTWQGAEKTYADFELSVTNPGGHSSAPRPVNAINQLAAALVRIGQYQFKPEVSDLTRAYFVQAAKYEEPAIAAAMRAFAADPTDKAAIATLTANYETVGKIGTTCVSTMVSGGHALNALPQRATANINCRIFPGTRVKTVQAKLTEVIGDRVWGFGHPFNNEGSIALPMGSGRINAIIPNLQTSFKLGSIAQEVGALTTDGSVGVAGEGPDVIHERAIGPTTGGLLERNGGGTRSPDPSGSSGRPGREEQALQDVAEARLVT